MPPAAVYSVHAHHYDYAKADQLNLDIPQTRDHSTLGHCYSAEGKCAQTNCLKVAVCMLTVMSFAELGLEDNAEALLLSERRSIDSLPASIAHGIKHGLVWSASHCTTCCSQLLTHMHLCPSMQ